MEIKDAVAVVTGGASGLGLATTKRLLDRGAQVDDHHLRAAVEQAFGGGQTQTGGTPGDRRDGHTRRVGIVPTNQLAG
ncbi:hypothetical protein MAHJHV28_45500 [Mycobacterium avium subsp. hominissuis]